MGRRPFDKQKDAASYDPVAASYGRAIEKLSAPLARRAVELARLREGQRVLDVGTGTGIVALSAARSVGASGTVLGIDLSEGMLRVAADQARVRGIENAEFRRMDAESLDLPDASFDAVVSLCAIAHFPDVAKAIAEMVRVLRPGGRLVAAIGCGRPPAGRGLLRHLVSRLPDVLRLAAGRELRAPASAIALVTARVPEAPGEDEEPAWARRDPTQKLLAVIEATGLTDVETCWEGHTVRFDSPEEFWEAQASVVTPVRKRLASLSPEEVAKLREEFLEKARRTLDNRGILSYPYGAYFVSGQRESGDSRAKTVASSDSKTRR